MIEFMVLGLPRSGTTWAANWLTTETTHCLHDPLFERHYTELDAYETKKRLGVSCTGLYRFPDWVNQHPARKVILHRDLREINESLAQIGLAELPQDEVRRLNEIQGMHVHYTALFHSAPMLWAYLLGSQCDMERHRLLCGMEIQPDFEGLTVGHEVTRKLLAELAGVRE